MTLHVVWEKCAVTNPATKEDAVLNRGDELPDYVEPFIRSTLVQIGAVKDFGMAVSMVQAAEDAQLDQTERPAPQLSDEIPPGGPGGPASAMADPEPVEEIPYERPAQSDNKETWEKYAVACGYFTQAEAESMTKRALMDAVNEREAA